MILHALSEFINSIYSYPAGVAYCPVPILAVIAAAGSLYQMGKGISQDAKAKSLEKGLQRPSYNPTPYEIPKEVDQYLNRTKMRALDTRLPGQSTMEDRISGSTANAIAATQQSGASPAEIINSIMGIQRQQNQAVNNLNVAAAENYQNKQLAVDSALNNKAQYQDRAYGINQQNADKSFQINQYDPYKERAAAISALKGASQQNIYGGINGLSSIAMSSMSGAGGQKTQPPVGANPQVSGTPYSGVPMSSAGTAPQAPQPQDYYSQSDYAKALSAYSSGVPSYNGPYRPDYGQPLNPEYGNRIPYQSFY